MSVIRVVTRPVYVPENREGVLEEYTELFPEHDCQGLVIVVLARSGLVDPGDEWGIFGSSAH